jgi:hypothetical protein
MEVRIAISIEKWVRTDGCAVGGQREKWERQRCRDVGPYRWLCCWWTEREMGETEV